MEATHQVLLLTPEKTLLDGEVVSIVAPGSEGFLGILAHHAPLITALAPGPLKLTFPDGREEVYSLSGGFLEVSHNRTVILADAAERSIEIDRTRAETARDRAQERLKKHDPGLDGARAQAALARSLGRLRVVAHYRTPGEK